MGDPSVSRLSQIYEERIQRALAALDPSYSELLRMAVDYAALRHENEQLRARVDELQRASRTSVGPAVPAVFTGEDGRHYVLERK